MKAIGLNPIRLDRIGLDPIRINAIKLGVPGAASGTDRPYIDPEVLASLKAVCICYGKSNDDPDRSIVKNLVDPDNPFVISNAAYTEGSGYAPKGSPYYGAFVTDGVDDLITSTKTVQEMLGGSNEITVVSMSTPLSFYSTTNLVLNNYIRKASSGFIRNNITQLDKTGIFGYSISNINNYSSTSSVINNILGDKSDCSKIASGSDSSLFDVKFSVNGYLNGNSASEVSSVAWYWTVIANKVLTTDQINQVIAYYNLDRCVEPTVWYDVQKQGLTNETPNSDWYLKDFSKNGFDMSLFNFAKKGNSGVGKYNFSSINPLSNRFEGTVTSNKCHFTKKLIDNTNNFCDLLVISPNEPIKFKVSGLSDGRKLFVANKSGSGSNYNFDNGEHEVSLSFSEGVGQNNPFGVTGDIGDIDVTVEFIPSHAGALCLDGVDDYGKVTGLPIYKDYTAIVCREFISDKTAPILSKAKEPNNGAFVVEIIANPDLGSTALYSFGKDTPNIDIIQSKSISYQTKYIYNSKDIVPGDGVDSDTMWLGKLRDNHTWFANAAIYSLMTFPYSLSEFLIERQLKKRKAGTLYPDMVEFRPVIKSNVELATKLTFAIRGTSTLLNAGDYIPKDSELWVIVTMNNLVDELTKFSINGREITIPSSAYNPSTGKYGFPFVIDNKYPQKINITIDEYIRYEDIVQPYPSMIDIYDAETDYKYTWGDKLKVGSNIKFKNYGYSLLPDFYDSWFEVISKDGLKPVELNTEYEIFKGLGFYAHNSYKLGNNEPKCVLSPSRLRIPNSSYKILGYIPDISGHGNHGIINNSAYAGMSGANGYLQNFSDWTKATGVTSTDSTIVSGSNLDATKGWVAYVLSGTVIPTFKVQISGIPTNSNLRFEGSDQSLANGVNTIQGLTTTIVTGFYISSGYDNDWSNLKIEQIGEYEGAYCLDGVDDSIELPTNLFGIKQVLLNSIWQSSLGSGILYDSRGGTGNGFALFNNNRNDNGITSPAYNNKFVENTYIDGIKNEYILVEQLLGKKHIAVCTRDADAASPILGSNKSRQYYCNMAIYDCILFDEISTDEEIATLNKYIGIEPKVTVPPYYWDAYGRSNMEAAYDRALMLNLGKIPSNDTSNALTANNFAWDLMSGYGGWEFPKFTDDVAWHISPNTSIEVVNRTNYSVTLRKLANTDYFYFQKAVGLIYRQVPFKVRTDKAIKVCWDLHYTPTGGTEQSLRLVEQLVQPNVDTMVTLTYKTEEELNDLNADFSTVFYIVYFDLYTMIENEEVTVTELPLYPNGLCFDGVDDYLLNRNIPVFTDFTVISKRIWLEENTSNKPFIIKGDTLYPDGIKNAFLFEYGKLSTYCFGQNNKYDESVVPSLISYATKQSYNGVVSLVKGSATDTIGLDIAHNTRMVFYKLMLYPKTLTNLEIMFLKNMFEKDEIIDLTNPIFIQE